LLSATTGQSGETEETQQRAGRLGDRNCESDLAKSGTVASRRGDSEEIVGRNKFHVAGVDVVEREALAGSVGLGDSGD
jgi:hypothetical protein